MPLTAITNTNPLSGVLTFNANGSFVYSPTIPLWRTWNHFTYHANDGALNSNIVTVTLNVAPDQSRARRGQ